jgi:hypothetical protein
MVSQDDSNLLSGLALPKLSRVHMITLYNIIVVWMCPPKVHALETWSLSSYVNSI